MFTFSSLGFDLPCLRSALFRDLLGISFPFVKEPLPVSLMVTATLVWLDVLIGPVSTDV